MLTAGVIIFAVAILYSFLNFMAITVEELGKPKDLNAMYRLLLKEYGSEVSAVNDKDPFICSKIYKISYSPLGINLDLFYEFKNHFHNNRPTESLHPEFYKKSLYYTPPNLCWWSMTEDGIRERIKFIEKMIKITEDTCPE